MATITVDTSELRTAAEISAEATAAANEMGRLECRRRILEVVDETAQINIAGAAAGGLLTPTQLAIFQSGLVWIGQMRATWPVLVSSQADLSDNNNWPAVPAGVADLASAF